MIVMNAQNKYVKRYWHAYNRKEHVLEQGSQTQQCSRATFW